VARCAVTARAYVCDGDDDGRAEDRGRQGYGAFVVSSLASLGGYARNYIAVEVAGVSCAVPAYVRARDSSGNAADYAHTDTPSGGLPVLRGFSRSVKQDSEASNASGGVSVANVACFTRLRQRYRSFACFTRLQPQCKTGQRSEATPSGGESEANVSSVVPRTSRSAAL
jgi:hypothetical protein